MKKIEAYTIDNRGTKSAISISDAAHALRRWGKDAHRSTQRDGSRIVRMDPGSSAYVIIICEKYYLEDQP